MSGIHVFPITITCLLQGTLCDTGIPCLFYGENICSVYWKITEQRIFLHGISKYSIFSLYGLRCKLNKKLLISEADNNRRNGIRVQYNILLRESWAWHLNYNVLLLSLKQTCQSLLWQNVWIFLRTFINLHECSLNFSFLMRKGLGYFLPLKKDWVSA